MSVVFEKSAFLYGDDFDIVAYLKNIKSIFDSNHFRLPNLLMPWVILLPKWIPAFLSFASLIYIFIAGSRLGRFENSWKAMVLFTAGVVFLFPWIDQLYLISFQAPYLWGTALTLLLIRWVLSERRQAAAALFIYSFFIGFWLEIYGGALLGACVCLALFYKSFRNSSIASVICGLICGIMLAAVPLILQEKWTKWPYFEMRMELIYPYILPTLIYMAVCVVLLRKHKSYVINSLNLTLLEISVAASLLTLYFCTGVRLNGLGIVCSIIGIIYLLRPFFGKGYLSAIVSSGIFIFSIIHLIVLDELCYRLGKETDYVLDRYMNKRESPVFAEITLREDVPWIALQKPYFDWFAHHGPVRVFNEIYGNENLPLVVVPKQLENFTPEVAECIDGDSCIYYYQGYLVTQEGDTDLFYIDYGNGPVIRYFYTVDFTGADGKKYTWNHLDYALLEAIMNPRPISMHRYIVPTF